MDFVSFAAALQLALIEQHQQAPRGSVHAAAAGLLVAVFHSEHAQRALWKALQAMRLV